MCALISPEIVQAWDSEVVKNQSKNRHPEKKEALQWNVYRLFQAHLVTQVCTGKARTEPITGHPTYYTVL